MAVLSFAHPSHWFKGFSSFVEDFWPPNGQDPRKCDLANGWKRNQSDGTWTPWAEAKFNHSADDGHRYDGEELGDALRLGCGGDIANHTPQYTVMTRSMPLDPPLYGKVLKQLDIVGPETVSANSWVQFTCSATWSDGSTEDVTNLISWFGSDSSKFTSNALDLHAVRDTTDLTITAQLDLVSTMIQATKILRICRLGLGCWNDL